MANIISLFFFIIAVAQIVLGIISFVDSVKKGKKKTNEQKRVENTSKQTEFLKKKEVAEWKQKLSPLLQSKKANSPSRAQNYQEAHDKKDIFQSISSQLQQMEKKHLSSTQTATFKDQEKKDRYMPEVDLGEPIAVLSFDDVQEEREEFDFTQEDVVKGILYSEIMEKPLSLR